MRSLFWKIFAWFGTAQLLIVVALFLLASATQRGFDQGLARAVSASLESRAQAAAVAYEAGGIAALRSAWRSSRRRGPRRDDGRGGGGFPAFGLRGPGDNGPDGLEDRYGASLFALSNGKPVRLVGPPVPDFAENMVAQAFANGSAELDSTGRNAPSFLAQRVETASGARFVGVQPLGFRGRGFGALGEWLRLDAWMPARFATVALLMGALCFGLARYLSAPARSLRAATRQFADGDFSTRVGPKMGKRRDELADMGRDFDAMAERIEELVTAQRRLLSDISHELRSPLARLNVAVELAGDTATGETCDYLRRISEESAELDAMIGQLLTIQRLESRETKILKTPLGLPELVKSVVENVNFEARSHGAEIEIKQLDRCELEGNPELLRSALQNVARNAVLHSGQKKVEVWLEKEGAHALICVRDFGPGVPEDVLEKLFDPFYRVASDRARQSGGTGLGLSITKRAVEAHGGTVRALNADGGGLCVEIRLPLEGTE